MMIIELTVAVDVGFAFGAMWGLSQHRALLDWLQARTIRRWMAAMQSLGYEQEDIDAVLERMGSKIMPPYIPAPTHVLTPEKPSLSEKLTELHIDVATHEAIPAEDVDVIMQLCIDYAQRMSQEQVDESAMTDYDVFLPVLMPLDTKESWNGEPLEIEKRIDNEMAERKQTGKPYVFKICEVKEG